MRAAFVNTQVLLMYLFWLLLQRGDLLRVGGTGVGGVGFHRLKPPRLRTVQISCSAINVMLFSPLSRGQRCAGCWCAHTVNCAHVLMAMFTYQTVKVVDPFLAVWTLKQRSRGWCAGWLIVAHLIFSSQRRLQFSTTR